MALARLSLQRDPELRAGRAGVIAFAMSQVVALPLAIPGTVIASLLGFHMLFVLQTQLRYVIKLVRGSDIEVRPKAAPPCRLAQNLWYRGLHVLHVLI